MGRSSGALETGVIYCDDNLTRMASLPSESVDLIYLDPPFFSSRIYEVIWGDEAEVRSFADRWEGGIQVYTNWMRDRIMEMYRLLKKDGSLYIHCDWHASHYLKVMLDGIFGPTMFRNELIWHYNTGGKGKTAFLRKHDTIFWYSKSAKYQFHRDEVAIPRAVGTAHLRHGVDGDGREYYEDFSPRKSGKLYRWYLDEGVTPMDVWTDIQALNPMASERLGYPTQKPEALLARILAASSKPGDVVLDPFCGCGTTVSVAQKTGRQWVGIDISPTAVNIMDRRIKRIPGARSPKLIGLPSTVDDLRTMKPFEFQNWVIQQFFGVSSPRKSGDMGIDGYTFLSRDPIQVKRSDKVGRNVVDNFQTAIRRDGSTTGWIVAFSFTKDAREEVARAKWQEKLDIHLITVADMLKPKAERRGPFWPEPATVTELPLNPPRDVRGMTGEDLVRSDQAASAV